MPFSPCPLSPLKKAGPVLQELTPEQQKGVEALSQAMINKILHDPITFLKKPGDPFQVSRQADLTQKIFNLNAEGETEDNS